MSPRLLLLNFPMGTVLGSCRNRPHWYPQNFPYTTSLPPELKNQQRNSGAYSVPLFQPHSTSIFVIKIQFGVSTFIGFPFITISFFS